MKTLQDWAVVSSATPYTAPECITQSLRGKVYGHTKFTDGESVITSYIIGKRAHLVVTKSGSLYKLGRVSKEYAKLYPNARKRLFNSLPEVGEIER